MINITVGQALEFAERTFPHAPEELADFLGIEVRRSPLSCDGWCLQTDRHSVIRINSESAEVRQRFTLAHELGHLIYNVTAVVGENVSPFQRKNKEEREIDRFAAELLLPTSLVLNTIKEIPITAKTLQKFARSANVSPLTVALRVANLSTQIGLNNASVVLYERDRFKWQWSETLELTGDTPSEILAECTNAAPNPARIFYKENEIIVASFIENPSLNTKVLFLQLVNEFDGFKQLREERMRELEKLLFENDNGFRQSLAGRFGAFKKYAQKMFLNEATEMFTQRILQNPEPLNLELLLSEEGREYITLKLQTWTRKA